MGYHRCARHTCDQVVKVDGGVSQSQLLLQLLADAMHKPVARPANIETTALGAAVAAAIGARVYAGACRAAVGCGMCMPPSPAAFVSAPS